MLVQGSHSRLQYVRVGIVGGSDQAKICEQLGANGEITRHMHTPAPRKATAQPFAEDTSCAVAALWQQTMKGKSSFCMHAVPRVLMSCGFCAAPLEYDYLFSENGLVAYKDGKVMAHPHPHALRMTAECSGHVW